MDYQIVKNRIMAKLDDEDVFCRREQITILNKVESELQNNAHVSDFLDAILYHVGAASNKRPLVSLAKLAKGLLNQIEDIENLKSYQYDLFQSGFPLHFLKDYSEVDVIEVINSPEYSNARWID